jgi:hypothetical protein
MQGWWQFSRAGDAAIVQLCSEVAISTSPASELYSRWEGAVEIAEVIEQGRPWQKEGCSIAQPASQLSRPSHMMHCAEL